MDKKMPNKKGWFGVDFDGTLVTYDGYKGPGVYGEPIQPMVDRVQRWLTAGKKVKVFTARVAAGSIDDGTSAEDYKVRLDACAEDQFKISEWCERQFGHRLEVTCTKDQHMIMLYDDRCRQVEKNTGRVIGDKR